MNVLREVRRANHRSMPVRIILLLSFCVIFVVTTYAWFSTQKDVKFEGLKGYTTPWDVSYYINSDEEQTLDTVAEFIIEDMYPGMPEREDIVHIYNLGQASSNVKYELVSVKVFGQEILTEADEKQYLQVHKVDENGDDYTDIVPVTRTTDGKVTNIFSDKTEFPFNVNYTYDKTKLIGAYEVDGEYEESAQATFKLNVSWPYEGDGTDTENLAKDVLDTKFGKEAYEYYLNNESTNAIEIKIRITSSMVHPKDDPDYPYDDYPYGKK